MFETMMTNSVVVRL